MIRRHRYREGRRPATVGGSLSAVPLRREAELGGGSGAARSRRGARREPGSAGAGRPGVCAGPNLRAGRRRLGWVLAARPVRRSPGPASPGPASPGRSCARPAGRPAGRSGARPVRRACGARSTRFWGQLSAIAGPVIASPSVRLPASARLIGLARPERPVPSGERAGHAHLVGQPSCAGSPSG